LNEHKTLPHIETERLLLRPWRASDRQPWADMNADPRVREFFPGTLTREESDASQDSLDAHITRHGFGFWALEEKSTGAFLGFTGLLNTSFPAPFTPCVEIGWRLAPHCWGKGYATEAARASLDHGFRTLRSRRVMERIGMHHDPDGDFDHPNIPAGNPLRRHVLYRISAAEYAQSEQKRSAEENRS
jgi:RimJ/RimL family protein N-acetyltransferase